MTLTSGTENKGEGLENAAAAMLSTGAIKLNGPELLQMMA